MIGIMPRSGRSLRSQSASKALSAGKCPADRALINASVTRSSLAFSAQQSLAFEKMSYTTKIK
jgi:hypothetical protein